MLTLDVLIATHTPEGIRRVADMDLPHVDNVRYIVSWQNHKNAPVPRELGSRVDVSIFRLDLPGVSNNRNNALEHSTAEICLMADDDLHYLPSQLEAVIRTFEENPEVDYASFMYEGANRKPYPATDCDLATLPKNFYQSAIEIAVRRDSPAGKLRFHPAFGPGSPRLHAAEDEMFLLTARRLGVKCHFFPVVITRHDGLSTGNRRIDNLYVLWAFGAFINYLYPRSSVLRIPLKAWRLHRARQANFFYSLYNMFRGVAYASAHVLPLWKEASHE